MINNPEEATTENSKVKTTKAESSTKSSVEKTKVIVVPTLKELAAEAVKRDKSYQFFQLYNNGLPPEIKENYVDPAIIMKLQML